MSIVYWILIKICSQIRLKHRSLSRLKLSEWKSVLCLVWKGFISTTSKNTRSQMRYNKIYKAVNYDWSNEVKMIKF